jgi:hypothetical protein
MNLQKLSSALSGTKLYGSVMAGLLRNDDNQSGTLPNFYDPDLQRYLRRIISEVVFPNMDYLMAIICLGAEACKVVGAVIESAELEFNYRNLRDAAQPIEFEGKLVFAAYHPRVLGDYVHRVWSAAARAART